MNELNYKKFLNARNQVFGIMDKKEGEEKFSPPSFEYFNWVNDWFSRLVNNNHNALVIIDEKETKEYSYKYLISSSSKISNYLIDIGVKRGDSIFINLDNQLELFQIIISAIQMGVIVILNYPNMPFQEIYLRIKESQADYIITSKKYHKSLEENNILIPIILVDDTNKENLYFLNYKKYSDNFVCANTKANEKLFGYFTSGTTSRPKLVYHTHTSYSVGHLSSMLFNGVRKKDRHLCLSLPGWAKHSWSSFFVPWNAESTNIIINIKDIKPLEVYKIINEYNITSFCAPTTFWRNLIDEDIRVKPSSLREITTAGEPLDNRLIEKIQTLWKLNLRSGYGQTEATAIVAQAPNKKFIPGSIGTPLIGYKVTFLDLINGKESNKGELCIKLAENQMGIMLGYKNLESNDNVFKNGYYLTGDIGYQDDNGNIFLEGRNDKVFKSFDFKISPYQIESLILEYPEVSSVLVVPISDKLGGMVPKAYIILKEKVNEKEFSFMIKKHINQVIPSQFTLKHIEFCDFIPRTYSGKINRNVSI